MLTEGEIKKESPPSGTKVARQFGVVGVFFFGILAALLYLRDRHTGTYIFGGLSAFFILIRFVATPLLMPVFKGWTAVAMVLNRISTAILLSIVYFLVFTPMGLLMRLFGKDPMKRRRDPKAPSYWDPRPESSFDKKRYEQRF